MVTGCTGAVGRIIFKCGILVAIIWATSAKPSAVSPSPWLITMRPDWLASFLGEMVMVVPERATRKGAMLNDDRDLVGVGCERRRAVDDSSPRLRKRWRRRFIFWIRRRQLTRDRF